MFEKYFKITLILLIFVEVISLVSYFFPLLNLVGFLAIVICTLIFSLYKLEYGLYILLAELFVGSKGYLFYFEYDEILFSIRMALFLIIFGVWLGKFLIERKTNFFKSIFKNYWLLLIFFIIWGVIRGVLSNNDFSNIFLDANAWFFLFLFLPAVDVIKNDKCVKNIIQILFASILILSTKTLISLFIFTHFDWEISKWVFDFYRWIRDTGVGEATSAGGGFFRVFFQSQIWVLVGLLILIFNTRLNKFRFKNNIFFYILSSLLFATIFTSFSRSFWVGGVVGSIVAVGLLFYLKNKIKDILIFLSKIIFVGMIGFLIVFLISSSFIDTIGKRATRFEGAAISSRWNLLLPLWKEIKDDWILGSGFGTTVTYQTQDPRILQSNPSGWYTTYAFEWGYLDIWLKLGIGGLFVYLFFIGKIFYSGFKKVRLSVLNIGLLSGFVALCAVHMFSPYLNHPLGIGYIVLLSNFFDKND